MLSEPSSVDEQIFTPSEVEWDRLPAFCFSVSSLSALKNKYIKTCLQSWVLVFLGHILSLRQVMGHFALPIWELWLAEDSRPLSLDLPSDTLSIIVLYAMFSFSFLICVLCACLRNCTSFVPALGVYRIIGCISTYTSHTTTCTYNQSVLCQAPVLSFQNGQEAQAQD